ncbi:PrgI family mobile element protein [Cohnella sp. AR92]|uniref:PrgI family mobile element protein n=1 Tax=Cohnella sp. AR92 TaxID=648716 RepID=UPI000F8D746F|nr:hypothetical protein ELR57_22270 [Cohnella sp. AR92]
MSYLRALLPFDTEKERRPVKIWDWTFSWRQSAYFGAAVLLLLQLCQWVYTSSLSIIVNLIIWVLCIPVVVPFVVFALYRHPQTGHFLDRHLWYHLRHKKTQSGVWRGN